MNYFYYKSAGRRIGTVSKADLMGLVGNDSLALNDMIFDVRTLKWLPIFEHPDFLRTNEGKLVMSDPKGEMTISVSIAPSSGLVSKAIPNKSAAVDPKQPQLKWHFKSGLTTLGPVTTLDLLAMYMRKELNDNDLVKNDKEIEWKTVKKIFPPELLEQIKLLEPIQDKIELPENAVNFHQLIYMGNKSSQYIVHGISISPNQIEFAMAALVFAQAEELICNFYSSKGRYTILTGVVTEISSIPCKFDEFPLVKYTIKFNTQFSLSGL